MGFVTHRIIQLATIASWGLTFDQRNRGLDFSASKTQPALGTDNLVSIGSFWSLQC